MTFRDFLIKCNCCYYTLRHDIKDYEIDYLFEKANELGFDKLELARNIADIKEKMNANSKKYIIFNGELFKSKYEIAKHINKSMKFLEALIKDYPNLFEFTDDFISWKLT